MNNQAIDRMQVLRHIFSEEHEFLYKLCGEKPWLCKMAFTSERYVSWIFKENCIFDVPVEQYNYIFSLALVNIKTSTISKILELMNNYRDVIDLSVIFEVYLDICESKYSEYRKTFVQVCNYMYINKVDINIHIDLIIVQMITKKITDANAIEGLYMNVEQLEFFNSYVNSTPDTFEYVIYEQKPKGYTQLWAMIHCRYRKSELDEFMWKAYMEDCVVAIKKYHNTPSYNCIDLYTRHTYKPTPAMNNVKRLYKIKTHKFQTSTKRYKMNDVINYPDVLKTLFGIKLNDKCTVKELCTMVYNQLILRSKPYTMVEFGELKIEDIMKHEMFLNSICVDVFTNLGRNDVYLHFGNFMHFILDNYL